MDSDKLLVSPDFLEQVKAFKADWLKFYQNISREQTPKMDGTGKKIILPKGNTGYSYIEESHMRNMLDKHFPGWSWEMAAPLQFLGAEWVVAQGHLIVIDEHLTAFGVVPPVRKYYGVDSVRIQYGTKEETDPKDPKRKIRVGLPHSPENIIDVGDNCKSATTAAMKYAINRLCHIGDDVYGKRTEYEGAGTVDDMMEANPSAVNFATWLNEKHVLISDAERIVGAKLEEIVNFSIAKDKIKQAKGW